MHVVYVTNLINNILIANKLSIVFFLSQTLLFIHLTYSRFINAWGDIYEGGLNMSWKHGKGEMEYYSEDGRIEKGEWVMWFKQGEFEVTYEDGTKQMVMYKDDWRVEEEDAKD